MKTAAFTRCVCVFVFVCSRVGQELPGNLVEVRLLNRWAQYLSYILIRLMPQHALFLPISATVPIAYRLLLSVHTILAIFM